MVPLSLLTLLTGCGPTPEAGPSEEPFAFQTTTSRRAVGTVVDADGDPVEGAIVALYTVDPDGRPRRLAKDATNAEGALSLRVVMPLSRDAFTMKVLQADLGMFTVPDAALDAWLADPTAPINIQLDGGLR